MKFPYREAAVGSLLWAARTSRPDILYAVGKVSSHCNNPSMAHVNAVKHILRYLKGTATIGITYHRAPELIFGATEYTTSIDIWSIGCVFYEYVT